MTMTMTATVTATLRASMIDSDEHTTAEIAELLTRFGPEIKAAMLAAGVAELSRLTVEEVVDRDN
jgi:hypothetical protein